jgi:hypothetical protein
LVEHGQGHVADVHPAAAQLYKDMLIIGWSGKD